VKFTAGDLDDRPGWAVSRRWRRTFRGTTKFPSGDRRDGEQYVWDARCRGYFKVFGSKGWLEMNPAFNYDGSESCGPVFPLEEKGFTEHRDR